MLHVGDAFWDLVAEHGNIFNLSVFWVDQFLTIEPEHIKVCRVMPSTRWMVITLLIFQQVLATEFDNFEKGRSSCTRGTVLT